MYNATAYKYDAEGNLVSVEAVQVDAEGRVLRACGTWSPLNGTPEFDAQWRAGEFSFVASVQIIQDNAAGYRARIAGLDLPASYLEA